MMEEEILAPGDVDDLVPVIALGRMWQQVGGIENEAECEKGGQRNRDVQPIAAYDRESGIHGDSLSVRRHIGWDIWRPDLREG